jgi:hypothetical protein
MKKFFKKLIKNLKPSRLIKNQAFFAAVGFVFLLVTIFITVRNLTDLVKTLEPAFNNQTQIQPATFEFDIEGFNSLNLIRER